MNIWHAIGTQLRHPSGIGGRIIGRAMRWANDRPTRLVVEALDPQPGDHVLDVGCGSGHAVALLAERVGSGHVTGIDQSATMIAQACAANARTVTEGRVTLASQDFHDLALDPASIDGIIASNVIYFWRDPPGTIARFRKLLRPGGRLVIYATAAITMRRWKFAATDTHHLIDRPTLVAALLDGGFLPEGLDVREVSLPANITGLIAVATVA